MVNIIKVNELSSIITKKYDLFICFNSFEKRCTTIATYIPKNQFNSFLVFTNEKHLEYEDNNLETLGGAFLNKAEVVELDLLHPIDIADKISDALENIDRKNPLRSIFIDVTTFTHETLLIILAILTEKYSDVEILCGYNNAKEYSIDKDSLKTKWLSRGIGDVRSVLGYSGNIKPSQNNLLMVIVGYEYERAARIIDEIAPDELAIGYNIEDNATTEKDRNASAGYAKLLKNMDVYFEHTTEFVVPCDNPYETYLSICKKLDSIPENTNITIVPMNNKLSTIGVALIGLIRPDVQICYAPALIYNTSAYSLPGEKCYIFPFDKTMAENITFKGDKL